MILDLGFLLTSAQASAALRNDAMLFLHRVVQGKSKGFSVQMRTQVASFDLRVLAPHLNRNLHRLANLF